jgi:hypothetical protein
MTGVALEKVICLRHAATMALIADIANNTGPILSIFRISCPMHRNARSIQSSFPHSLIFMSQYVTIHGSGLPKLGDVRHHFEIRVLAPRSQSCRKLHDPGNVQTQSYTMPLTAMSEVGVGVVDPVAAASVYSARLQSWIRWQISQLSDLSGCCCLMQQPKTLLQADRHGNGFIEKQLLGMHILIIHSSYLIILTYRKYQEMYG